MAHPYAKHSETAVGHRRANKLMSGREYKRADGGRISVPPISKSKTMTAGAASGVGALQKAHGAGVRK